MTCVCACMFACVYYFPRDSLIRKITAFALWRVNNNERLVIPRKQKGEGYLTHVTYVRTKWLSSFMQ